MTSQTTLSQDVNNRVSELWAVFAETRELVPTYTRQDFVNNIKKQYAELSLKANAHTRANAGGHLDNEAMRIELLAMSQIIK